MSGYVSGNSPLDGKNNGDPVPADGRHEHEVILLADRKNELVSLLDAPRGKLLHVTTSVMIGD